MTAKGAWRELYERGFSLVPLAKNKKALVPWKQYQYERADLQTIKDWLAQWPDANPGIVTGNISGIFVLDIDGIQGRNSLLAMGLVPDTPYVETKRGLHYYFKYPDLQPGQRIITKAGIGVGIDIRGDGGYVVGPGATHETGFLYRWANELLTEFLPAPEWLLDIAITDEADPLENYEPIHIPQNTNGKGDRAYALAALRGEADKVANAPDGYKHDRLLRSACAVGGFVGILTEQEIEQALYEAVAPRARDKRAARITIRDGIDWGSRRPRDVPKGDKAERTESADKTAPDPDSPDFLLTAQLSDTGNAECMAHLHGEDFRFDHTRRKWLTWDSHRWRIDGDGAAERAAVDTIKARQTAALDMVDTDKRKRVLNYLIGCENHAKQKGMLGQASILAEFATSIDRFDRGLWLAGTPNGVLDLATGVVHEPARHDLITMSMGTSVDPGAECPRWLRFLSEVFADDKELIAFIRRAVGYSLTGDTSEQKMFLCHGAGANGKSVFLETLSLLMGDYAAGTPFATFDADKRNESTNDLAALKGKRFVTVIESDEDRRLAEARVKAVTGQDTITCRFLYGEYFTYKPTFKLWMAMNHKPIIRGTDRGIWRRIVLIPFTQSFEGREDKGLADDLRAELPGILNWAASGCHQWLTKGLGAAKVVTEATEDYRKESDIFGQWFDDCCASSPADETLAADAYESFSTWCKTYGFRFPTQNSFSRSLTERGFLGARNRQGKRVYRGFILTDPITLRVAS